MKFKLYTERDVTKLVERLQEGHKKQLESRKEAEEELRSENRVLRARVLQLEDERRSVSEALVEASRQGERIRRERAAELENEIKELRLLCDKCRLLLDTLTKKYPDAEDVASFAAFQEELRVRLGGEEEESGFDMDEVISPKKPLDLEELCRGLGLMEDGE